MVPTHALHRRTNLTVQGDVAIIILVGVTVLSIICAGTIFWICKKHGKRKAMRRMQTGNAPSVENQYIATVGAQSSVKDQRGVYEQAEQNAAPYVYDGPPELQGSGKPGPVQLDGYTAAPTFDNDRPIEMASHAVKKNVSAGDGTIGGR